MEYKTFPPDPKNLTEAIKRVEKISYALVNIMDSLGEGECMEFSQNHISNLHVEIQQIQRLIKSLKKDQSFAVRVVKDEGTANLFVV